MRQRPWYYSRIFADSKDTNTVYALNVLLYKSTDGGEKFKHMPELHGDNHDMWIPLNEPLAIIQENHRHARLLENRPMHRYHQCQSKLAIHVGHEYAYV